MLIEFSVKNFLSFKDKNTFTMVASSDNTLEDNVVEVGNDKILKMSAIYGANASGKTNIFEVLANVSSMIKQSNFLAPNVLLPIVPFKLDYETLNKPSEFEIKFLVDGVRYLYGFKADKENVYEEYLSYYPNGRPVKIFIRKDINNYSFNFSDEKLLNDIKENTTCVPNDSSKISNSNSFPFTTCLVLTLYNGVLTGTKGFTISGTALNISSVIFWMVILYPVILKSAFSKNSKAKFSSFLSLSL